MRHYELRGLQTIFLLSLFVALVACRPNSRVVISAKDGKELTLRVEVADTPAKRALGLQFRNELADDQGMLFLFPVEGAQSFWMKNTPLPLDIIFIGSDLKIAGIIYQTVPFSTNSLSVSAPSQFVLEIKGGLSQRQGIEVGSRVRFENISLAGVKE